MMVLALSGDKVDEITSSQTPRCPAASVFPNTSSDKDGFDVKWTPPLRDHSGTLAQPSVVPPVASV